MSLCYPSPRWMNKLLWKRRQVTLSWGKCPSVLPVSQSRTETYQVLAAGIEDCHVQHCCELRHFGQTAYCHREYQFHSNSFLPHRCTSFQTEIKIQWENHTPHILTELLRHLSACVLGGKRAYNQQGRLLHPKTGVVIYSSCHQPFN